jgi:hypothetical protein
MRTQFLVLILALIFSACQTGRIPCPKVKADKIKRSVVKRNLKYIDRNATASIPADERGSRSHLIRTPEKVPPLEHINVEEWECPKPGAKRTVPKAVKDNIKKNRKAYESYYKNRPDSVHTSTTPGE